MFIDTYRGTMRAELLRLERHPEYGYPLRNLTKTITITDTTKAEMEAFCAAAFPGWDCWNIWVPSGDIDDGLF